VISKFLTVTSWSNGQPVVDQLARGVGLGGQPEHHQRVERVDRRDQQRRAVPVVRGVPPPA